MKFGSFKGWKIKSGLFILMLFLSSCSSYQSKVEKSRDLLRQGEYHLALEQLKPLALKQNDDQLVYLFDYATALQVSGDLKESDKYFLMAHDLAEVKDYHSISRIGGSLLFNEGMVQYKGEDYENVLINAMLAINFAVQGDLDAALVETKRLNEKLTHYKVDGKKNYEQNPFAFYLGASIWEANKQYDDAYIDYKKVYDLNPNIADLKYDLIRSSWLARRFDELKKWQAQFPNVKIKPEWKNKNYGELVLIYQSGWGPRKYPRPENARYPKLYPVPRYITRAKLDVAGGVSKTTQVIYNAEAVAIKTLDDAYAELVAKRVTGVVAKAVVSDQIRQKDKTAGDLAWIIMNLSDRADLRQWSTLPKDFQMAKVFLPAGEHEIKVVGLDDQGKEVSESWGPIKVKIKPRSKTYINWRTFK